MDREGWEIGTIEERERERERNRTDGWRKHRERKRDAERGMEK